MGTSFERVAMDLKSAAGFWCILVVLDYATQFPEAIPLRSATSLTVAAELVKIFAWVGQPWELLSDTNFTSQLLWEVCALLRIKKLQMSVYYLQTLKNMLQMFPAGGAPPLGSAHPPCC